ncbi:MAG: LPS export ABC transporter periplasmic protein LptC [Candidatus Thiodiazotropha sp.]
MKRRLLAPLLLLAAVLSLAWWVNELSQPESPPQQAVLDTPDAYADGLLVKRFDEQGLLIQSLQSPRMIHFDQAGVTEFTRPVVRQYSERTPPWILQAEKGVARHREENLFLPGDVMIDRPEAEGAAPYHIRTRDLSLEIPGVHVTTDQSVTVTSREQRITGRGLEAWLQEPARLRLLHQVRGHYVFD